jgi:hypothetical protein
VLGVVPINMARCKSSARSREFITAARNNKAPHAAVNVAFRQQPMRLTGAEG